jgi:hypothetical protein
MYDVEKRSDLWDVAITLTWEASSITLALFSAHWSWQYIIYVRHYTVHRNEASCDVVTNRNIGWNMMSTQIQIFHLCTLMCYTKEANEPWDDDNTSQWGRRVYSGSSTATMFTISISSSLEDEHDLQFSWLAVHRFGSLVFLYVTSSKRRIGLQVFTHAVTSACIVPMGANLVPWYSGWTPPGVWGPS